MIRAVLDTNIVISALFWKGLPDVVFNGALDKQYISLTTEALTMELKQVLAYPKFAERISSQALDIDRLVGDYLAICIAVLPAEVPSDIVRDPKDQAVLACALGGRAGFIISGDKDLLVLGNYKGIPIVNADQFLRHLSSE
jgi:putative PIN family toxin of toxin-antitoxin system